MMIALRLFFRSKRRQSSYLGFPSILRQTLSSLLLLTHFRVPGHESRSVMTTSIYRNFHPWHKNECKQVHATRVTPSWIAPT